MASRLFCYCGGYYFCQEKNENEDDVNEKYCQAKRVINKFIDEFPKLKDHIIIIPGNHDNDVPERLPEILDARKIFLDYCKEVDSREETKKKKAVETFSAVFRKQFEQYLSFSECYNPPQEYAKYCDENIIDSKIRDLAGVRIFEEHNLCFVPINTEWLYVPHSEIKKKIKAAITNGNSNNDDRKTDIENLSSILDKSVNIVEKCFLCSPLIKDAYHSLVELHKDKDYTVVTVMHRGPEYLPWEDKNPTDKAKTDSLGMILNLSDILLTGHEHQTRTTTPPSYIGNNVLHFKLGSVGRKEKNASEYVRWASLVHIDPLSGNVEHLPIEYDNTGLNWKIKLSNNNKYSIRIKHENDITKDECWRFGGSMPVLRVKSNISDLIEKKIKEYFGIGTNKDMTIINAESGASIFNDPEFIKSIEDLNCNGQQIKIVIYYMDASSFYEDMNSKSEQIKTMKKIDNFRAKYIESILLNRLIINEIIIEIR